MTPIRIWTTDGEETVDAEVIGQLAVHPTVTISGLSVMQWTVTHVLSGRQLATRFTKQANAVSFCNEAAWYDWDAYWQAVQLNGGKALALTGDLRTVKGILRKWLH